MKKIRLVIYNETYWNKGLIYSQNIMPLYSMSQEAGAQFEVISFTSLLMYLRKKNQIKSAKEELRTAGVIVKDRFVLVYPHSLFFPYRFMIPFLHFNVALYIWLFALGDKGKQVRYFLRSYQPALFFNQFYNNKHNLIFDTRTDWLEENINLGRIKRGGLTYNYWHKKLSSIVSTFRRTLCISEVCKDNMCASLNVPDSKIDVIYNPIDYSHFDVPKTAHKGVNFLYTGSIGNWNKLENYLKVFMSYNKINKDSHFTICTGTMPSIVNQVLNREEYDVIRESVEVHYNVKYDELPKYYSQCDYGFQLMEKPDSRVGVKFVEYIAAGVVPIINENVQGATYLAKKYGIGIVLGENWSEEQICEAIDGCKMIDKNSDEFISFKRLTDIRSIASRYANFI